MTIDVESERAALMVRAYDTGRTPGEQAATEEADKRAESPHAEVRATAEEWRELAVEARAEDLKNGIFATALGGRRD